MYIFPHGRDSSKCFAEICRVLYGNATVDELLWCINMAARK